jgi:purine-nucleoside phosphorylase
MHELAALNAIRQRAPLIQPRVAVVLGSGWGGLTEHVREPVCVPYSELDNFPQASVSGHSGMLWLGHIGVTQVAVMSGRKHGYETGKVDGMKVPLRVLKALGCEVLVQTNAAGSLRLDMPAQSLMLISDHINLPQRSPLVGESGSERFVSMIDAYDPALRALAQTCAQGQGLDLPEGIYAWAFGPQFETPAEIRMLRQMGADAVGMSTVPETILARHAGMRVLALSLITNMGAGLSTEQLSHAHTLTQAQSMADVASGLLADIIGRIEIPGR